MIKPAIKKLLKILFIGILLCIGAYFVIEDDSITVSKEDIQNLEHLDIIITSGQSVQSKLLRLFNGSVNSYTHVGIVCCENDEVYVLHATTDGTSENAIRYDSLQQFLNLSNVCNYAIARNPNIVEHAQSITASVEEYKEQKVAFDYEFNNDSKDELYCSELVYDIYSSSGALSSSIDLKKPIHPEIFTKLDELPVVVTRAVLSEYQSQKLH